MFDGFFEKNPPVKSEQTDKEYVDRIKAAVLKSIRENPDETEFDVCKESEVTPMKKRNIARTFVIAAAVASLGTMTLVSANAVTDNLSVSNNLTKTNIPAVTDRWIKADGSENECTADSELTDGQKESDNLTKNVPAVTDRWIKADGSENECIADGELTDGQKELYTIMAIDENGEEIPIARDYVEWVEYEDSTFDIMWDDDSSYVYVSEIINAYLGEYKKPESEEVLNETATWNIDGEDVETDNIRVPDSFIDYGDNGKWEANI